MKRVQGNQKSIAVSNDAGRQQAIRLSDDELTIVMHACRPLEVSQRDAFLQAVAIALAAETVIGPGTVYRVVAQVQKSFWDPPLDYASKYR